MSKLKYFILFFTYSLLFCHDNYVLMISFDGFRYDYMENIDTPNFDWLASHGVKANSLIPVFPSLTFPNHYSIATGAYAGKHNITGNVFYDKYYNQEYNYKDKNTVQDAKFYKSEPIWVTAERQGVKTSSFFWVGSEAPIKGHFPSKYKIYDGKIPFEQRIDSVMHWFRLPESIRPQLVMLYFSEPDYTGHVYGVNNSIMNEKIKEMDDLLGYIVKSLKKNEIFSKINIIVTSDHGMVNVSKERLIILDEYISLLDELNIYGNGSHMQIDFKNNNALIEKAVLQELKSIPNINYWRKDDIPKRFYFNNRNTGSILVLADEGWFLTTQLQLIDKEFSLKGMHGYDPMNLNMHGIFYAYGPLIKSNIVIPSFQNIHIYPFICKLLGIQPYIGKHDSPDGDINVLENIIER